MKIAFRLTIVIAVCLLAVVMVRGQQQTAAKASSKSITIGQSIEETRQFLKDRGSEFGDVGFQITNANPDTTHLFCVLDKESTQAAIFYSKSKKVVTGISLVFFPSNNHSKSTQAWLAAKSITLEPDGSYAVHFLPPRKADPAEPKPKSVYPVTPQTTTRTQ